MQVRGYNGNRDFGIVLPNVSPIVCDALCTVAVTVVYNAEDGYRGNGIGQRCRETTAVPLDTFPIHCKHGNALILQSLNY